MKRHSNLFEKITGMDNLRLAFRKARRGKSWQDTVKAVEADLEGNLARLQRSLIQRTFTTSKYAEKIILEPKRRVVYRLPFYPDRIVQHAIMIVVEPIWESMFIHDSYACRLHKGIHRGSRRTMEFVRRNKYCLKCDISKFYPSVDHEILYGIVQRKIKCPDTLWLFHDIIFSIGGGKNVPIGNYTSQWLGNLYLNELDQHLKHTYKIRDYIRYCDDFCLFHSDKAFLGEMAGIVESYVSDRLQLTLSKCDLFPVARGVDFLGYRHFPGYILLRKSTAKRVKKRLAILSRQLLSGDVDLDYARSSVASTMGWLRWANSHNFRRSLGIDSLWDQCNATQEI